MKRIALVLAASVLGSGCIVHDDTTSGGGGGGGIGTVNVYWEFVRTKLDQSLSTVVYDPFDSPNVAPGTGPCTTSGVDVVRLEGIDAGPIDVDCRFQGVQGVQLPGLGAGTYRATVSGWRGQHELYATPVDITVESGRTASQVVQLSGIPSNLEVAAVFRTANGASVYGSCGSAGVGDVAFTLVDFAGTVVAQGSAPCVDPTTPGFSLTGNQALDRDLYAIRLQGFASTADASADFDSSARLVNGCADPTFGHYADDTGGFAWTVNAYEVRAIAVADLCP